MKFTKAMKNTTLATLAVLILIGVGGAYGWYPYSGDYNRDYSFGGVYPSGTWYGNPYTSTIQNANVYDHWGYSYGYQWTDLNSANPYWGSWFWY